jgi:hypothetical protein
MKDRRLLILMKVLEHTETKDEEILEAIQNNSHLKQNWLMENTINRIVK